MTELPDASVVHLDVNVPAELGCCGGCDCGCGGGGGDDEWATVRLLVLINLTEYKSALHDDVVVWQLMAAGELDVAGAPLDVAGESDIE